MSLENRNNTAEITPNGQLDLFTELERTEVASDVPNPQTTRAIKESIQSGSQSIARLETTWRKDLEEDKLIDQGVTNRIGARYKAGNEASRRLLGDMVDKEAVTEEEYSPYVTVGGSPYPRGKSKPGYQRSKKGRKSSRDHMRGDMGPLEEYKWRQG